MAVITRANPSGRGVTSNRLPRILPSSRLTVKQCPRRKVQCLAGPEHNGRQSSIDTDSDLVFVGKVVAVSIVGGAVIKYGSLLTPFAFSESSVAAVLLVFMPPLIYAILLLTSKEIIKG